jgi:hypothetical protein
MTSDAILHPSARFVSCLLVLLSACGAPEDPAEDGASKVKEWAYEREFPGGEHPASLIVRIDQTTLSLAGRVTMEQELRVQAGFVAEFPEYLPEDFENFTVSAIERDTSTDGGARATSRRLFLEPNRSGELNLAPLAVYFHAEGEARESHFFTDEIQITVEAVEDVASLKLRPMRSIFDTPPQVDDQGAWRWVLGGGLLVAALGAIIYALRKRPTKAAPVIPPDTIAYDALRRLVALQLIEKDRIEEFFVHLSAILRTYIENRFRVHAPERTTEEFLEEATRHPALERHHGRLEDFLNLCDQVKFARYHPDEARVQGAFDLVKQFLEETRAEETVAA